MIDTAPAQPPVGHGAALARVRRRLEAAEPPWLHGEVARRMAERLALVRIRPETVLDWWAHVGASAGVLREAYPQARLVAVEAGATRRDATGRARRSPWWSTRHWTGARAEAVLEGDVTTGGAQLVWCNMGLHLQPDPQAVMARWHRALAVGGFLMFSTFGPGTLAELRATYRRNGWGPPQAPLVDMHDLGDMLVAAGFADPVMDQETLTLHWPDAATLLRELRGCGGNADPQRFAGMRTPGWRRRLEHALAAAARDGRPALSFEIVYGHAFRAPTRATASARTEVSLADMREMLAARSRKIDPST